MSEKNKDTACVVVYDTVSYHKHIHIVNRILFYFLTSMIVDDTPQVYPNAFVNSFHIRFFA